MGTDIDDFTLFLISVAAVSGLLPAVALVVHTLSDVWNRAALPTPDEMDCAPDKET